MYIDLSSKTVHCGMFSNRLVIGVWSRPRARQDWEALGLSWPLSRLAREIEERSEQRGRSPMRLYQVRSAGRFMIKTMGRSPAGPSLRYFLIRVQSSPGNRTGRNFDLARGRRIEIAGPVNRMGRFPNSLTAEERYAAVRPIFASKLWLNMHIAQLSFDEGTFVLETPKRTSRARPVRREQAERPTAWDRLAEEEVAI